MHWQSGETASEKDDKANEQVGECWGKEEGISK